jgi:hypothetical protein
MSRERSEMSAPEATASSREIIRLPPPRSGGNIDRWFLALDAQFQLTQVKSDVSKFYAVVANLGERQMELVEYVIIDSPKTDRYECLKAALIKRLSDSDNKRMEKLLEAQDLGDKKTLQAITKHAEIGRFSSLRRLPYDNVEETPSRRYEGGPKCGRRKRCKEAYGDSEPHPRGNGGGKRGEYIPHAAIDSIFQSTKGTNTRIARGKIR